MINNINKINCVNCKTIIKTNKNITNEDIILLFDLFIYFNIYNFINSFYC